MSNYWDEFIDQYKKEIPDLTLRQILEALCRFIESNGGSGAELFIEKTMKKNGETG